MADDRNLTLFGYEIVKKSKKKEQEDAKKRSFVVPMDDDGTAQVAAGGHYGQFLDLDVSKAKDDRDLIRRYRDAAAQPECDAAIEDIVNESIVSDEDSGPISLVTDDLDGDKLKKVLQEEFEQITKLLNFNFYGHDIFKRWYVDGRLFYHIIIDENNPKKGIIELRPIDPTRIRKVKKVNKEKDEKTGVTLIKNVEEYYLYQDNSMVKSNQGLKIAPDSVCYITSGLLDPSRKKVLSYLHKALKPVNQLRMMEDSLVIYRLSRAPERRIFYIDVGNLPKGKAEEYMSQIMAKHRNKLVYDAQSGELRDDRKHMSMLEDFWLPRREGGRGTEISTLPGGENLGQIDDIVYFQKNLYKALNVPVNRLEQEAQFSLGRSSEISRDEVKFQRFIDRIRKKFAVLFTNLLKTQMLLKGYMTEEEWEDAKNEINFDFMQDTYFAELKEAEIIRERMATLRELDDYVGKYYSVAWVRKNVLKQTEEEIEDINKEMEEEMPDDPEGMDGMGGDDLASRGF